MRDSTFIDFDICHQTDRCGSYSLLCKIELFHGQNTSNAHISETAIDSSKCIIGYGFPSPIWLRSSSRSSNHRSQRWTCVFTPDISQHKPQKSCSATKEFESQFLQLTSPSRSVDLISIYRPSGPISSTFLTECRGRRSCRQLVVAVGSVATLDVEDVHFSSAANVGQRSPAKDGESQPDVYSVGWSDPGFSSPSGEEGNIMGTSADSALLLEKESQNG